MIDIKSLNFDELILFLKDYDVKKFRVEQIYKWLHEKNIANFDEMSNIPKELRGKLTNNCYISVVNIEKKLISCYDSTIKYLFKLSDGEYIESVLMNYHFGSTLCLSTQVGCKMGCTFCATGQSGFTRDLTPSEMIAQIDMAQKDSGQKISNIVLMGMGEPLDNYDNVLKFIELITSEKGYNLGNRHITLSTCGVVDKIYKLADENLQLTLSISLHAPTDEIRTSMMPINKKYNIEKLLEACSFYLNKTNRRISFEYAVVKDINDNEQCALRLVKLLKGMNCHVNLIPVNETDNKAYKKSQKEVVQKFLNVLTKNGINATVRRTLGSDIDASCGQLRGKAKQ